MNQQLTKTQRKVYNFMEDFLQENHRTPSSSDISKKFGWSSANAGYLHRKALEKKGFIKTDENGDYKLLKSKFTFRRYLL